MDESKNQIAVLTNNLGCGQPIGQCLPAAEIYPPARVPRVGAAIAFLNDRLPAGASGLAH